MSSTTRILSAAAVAALALGLPSAAQADETHATPEHGHMLVLGFEFSDTGVTYDKCVDIAAGKALPVHVHHEGLHAGRAGDALRNAGHFPVPTAPLTPWENCEDLAEAFPQ